MITNLSPPGLSAQRNGMLAQSENVGTLARRPRAEGNCHRIRAQLGGLAAWPISTRSEPGRRLRVADTSYEDWHRVLDGQAVLRRSERIRAVGLPDLLIAAVAEREMAAPNHSTPWLSR